MDSEENCDCSNGKSCPRCLKPCRSASHWRSCRQKPQAVAVGDLVAKMLASCGLTKQRVQWLLNVDDCGCNARQEWLNRWGEKKQRQVMRLAKKAARWYGIG